jgi:histidinol-phosphate aminotransferase
VNKYTYWEELENKLSEVLNEEVAVTAGSTEAIYLSGILILRNLSRRVVIPEHTYTEYERISRMFGFKIIKTPLNPKSMAERVEKGCAVFFCNPNNPDGKYFSPSELKPLIDAVEDRKGILILDEAFKDFVKNFKSVEAENVVKLRTFTKSYGMPGIRVGYVMGYAEEYRSVRMPWSIGSAGYFFLERVIEDGFRFLKLTIPKIWAERERIARKIKLKSDANFFLLKADEHVLQSLEARSIKVRDCTSFGLPGYIRFAVKKPEENSLLLEALEL